MIYTADNYEYAVKKLTACRIPFQEVTLRTPEGRKPALKLDVTAFIMIQAGNLLTDN